MTSLSPTPPPPLHEEDKDDESYHVVKEEAMEDVPSDTGYLPPEY
jgi:hypothetical protein